MGLPKKTDAKKPEDDDKDKKGAMAAAKALKGKKMDPKMKKKVAQKIKERLNGSKKAS